MDRNRPQGKCFLLISRKAAKTTLEENALAISTISLSSASETSNSHFKFSDTDIDSQVQFDQGSVFAIKIKQDLRSFSIFDFESYEFMDSHSKTPTFAT